MKKKYTVQATCRFNVDIDSNFTVDPQCYTLVVVIYYYILLCYSIVTII